MSNVGGVKVRKVTVRRVGDEYQVRVWGGHASRPALLVNGIVNKADLEGGQAVFLGPVPNITLEVDESTLTALGGVVL